METILQLIEKRLENGSAQTSFTYLKDGEKDETQISLGELRADALNLGCVLKPDEPVLIILPQGLTFISALFGCLYSAAVAVPVGVPAKIGRSLAVDKIITETRSRTIITDRDSHEKIKRFPGIERFEDLNVLFMEDFTGSAPGLSELKLPDIRQPAFLQYTSGSTGKPKAVIVTHENIAANSQFILDRSGNTSASTSVSWLPCFHDMGLIEGIFQPVFGNFQSVIMSPVHFIQRPVRWLKAISKYRAATSGSPNFGFDYCTERIKDEELEGIDLGSLRCLYNGAEPIRPQTLRNFAKRFEKIGFSEEKIVSCYGLAEATLAVTISGVGETPKVLKVDADALKDKRVRLSTGENTVELVSCGKPAPDTHLKIVSEVSLTEMPQDRIGEIVVSGKTVADGYFGSEQNSSEAFFRSGDLCSLRTGDLGFIHKGELYVTGRIKDLIIIRGKNHYPQDLEYTAANSDTSLSANSCAAFSIIERSAEKLIILQEIKRSFLKNVDLSAAAGMIRKAVSRDHGILPDRVVLLRPGTLPKTTSGKIRRKECRRLFEENSFDPLADVTGIRR
ncbi:MAG: fatty acyl-AMP ligase [Pyrinomonadaceae bacterium]